MLDKLKNLFRSEKCPHCGKAMRLIGTLPLNHPVMWSIGLGLLSMIVLANVFGLKMSLSRAAALKRKPNEWRDGEFVGATGFGCESAALAFVQHNVVLRDTERIAWLNERSDECLQWFLVFVFQPKPVS